MNGSAWPTTKSSQLLWHIRTVIDRQFYLPNFTTNLARCAKSRTPCALLSGPFGDFSARVSKIVLAAKLPLIVPIRSDASNSSDNASEQYQPVKYRGAKRFLCTVRTLHQQRIVNSGSQRERERESLADREMNSAIWPTAWPAAYDPHESCGSL